MNPLRFVTRPIRDLTQAVVMPFRALFVIALTGFINWMTYDGQWWFKWVAFGMGNLLSAQSAACCPAATQDGVLLQVTVVSKAGRLVVGRLGYVPTWVEHPSYRVLPVVRTLAGGSAGPATRRARASRRPGGPARER